MCKLYLTVFLFTILSFTGCYMAGPGEENAPAGAADGGSASQSRTVIYDWDKSITILNSITLTEGIAIQSRYDRKYITVGPTGVMKVNSDRVVGWGIFDVTKVGTTRGYLKSRASHKYIQPVTTGGVTIMYANADTADDNQMLWLGGSNAPGTEPNYVIDSVKGRIDYSTTYGDLRTTDSYPLTCIFYIKNLEYQAKVALKSYQSNYYVKAELYQGHPMQMSANGTTLNDPQVMFDLIWLGNNKVQLRSWTNWGLYVCADEGKSNILIADRYPASIWETFDIIDQGNNVIVLRSHNSKFVTCNNNKSNLLFSGDTQISNRTKFQVIPLN
jgi:hypothetical protein